MAYRPKPCTLAVETENGIERFHSYNVTDIDHHKLKPICFGNVKYVPPRSRFTIHLDFGVKETVCHDDRLGTYILRQEMRRTIDTDNYWVEP